MICFAYKEFPARQLTCTLSYVGNKYIHNVFVGAGRLTFSKSNQKLQFPLD